MLEDESHHCRRSMRPEAARVMGGTGVSATAARSSFFTGGHLDARAAC